MKKKWLLYIISIVSTLILIFIMTLYNITEFNFFLNDYPWYSQRISLSETIVNSLQIGIHWCLVITTPLYWYIYATIKVFQTKHRIIGSIMIVIPIILIIIWIWFLNNFYIQF